MLVSSVVVPAGASTAHAAPLLTRTAVLARGFDPSPLALGGIAIDADGDLLVVGAVDQYDYSNPGAGVVQILRSADDAVAPVALQTLRTPDGGQQFGGSVAIEGTTVAVSELANNNSVTRVFTYEPVGGAWQLAEQIAPPAGASFIGGLWLGGGRLFAAIQQSISPSRTIASYNRTNAGWVFESTLGFLDGGRFDLAVVGDAAVVAGGGRSWDRWTHTSGGWTRTGFSVLVTPPAPGSVESIDFDGTRVAVGVRASNFNSPNSGQVNIYTVGAGGAIASVGTAGPPSGAFGGFGSDLALTDDGVAVGGPQGGTRGAVVRFGVSNGQIGAPAIWSPSTAVQLGDHIASYHGGVVSPSYENNLRGAIYGAGTGHATGQPYEWNLQSGDRGTNEGAWAVQVSGDTAIVQVTDSVNRKRGLDVYTRVDGDWTWTQRIVSPGYENEINWPTNVAYVGITSLIAWPILDNGALTYFGVENLSDGSARGLFFEYGRDSNGMWQHLSTIGQTSSYRIPNTVTSVARVGDTIAFTWYSSTTENTTLLRREAGQWVVRAQQGVGRDVSLSPDGQAWVNIVAQPTQGFPISAVVSRIASNNSVSYQVIPMSESGMNVEFISASRIAIATYGPSGAGADGVGCAVETISTGGNFADATGGVLS